MPFRFALPLAAIVGLSLWPELILQFQLRSDLKALAPVLYYETIVSLLLLVPALVLPPRGSRIWVSGVALLLVGSTSLVGFYALNHGARWNLTTHTALLQSNVTESVAYLGSFHSVRNIVLTLCFAAAFCLAGWSFWSAAPPSRSTRGWLLAGIALFCAYGLFNTLKYGRTIIRDIHVAEGAPVPMAEVKVNMLHPAILVAALHFNYHSTHAYFLQQFRDANANRRALAGATPLSGVPGPRVIVMAIGESVTRRHWSLYGYDRATTPRMDRIRDEVSAFSDVICINTGTLPSIRAMLTTEDARPIFGLFAAAGYATHWFSTQSNQAFTDLEIVALAAGCDESVYVNQAYDENLLPLLEATVAQPGRHLIFLHLSGSHVRYRARYPSRFAVFTGQSNAERLRAEYDNSILYTDFVLGEAIEILRRTTDSTCFLYVSDHGEDVFDSRSDRYLFRADSIASDPMYEVPFIVWLSPQYRRENPAFAAGVANATAHPFQNRLLYHSLVSLARLSHPRYVAGLDLFSPAFIPHDRQVGIPARTYQRAAGFVPPLEPMNAHP